MDSMLMVARSVQISLDEELLEEVDRQAEAQHSGRSALIRRALRVYLELKRRRAIDEAYLRAYGGKADEAYEEFAELIAGQSWPDE